MSDPSLKENNREDSGEGFVRERIINKTSPRRIFRKLLVTGVCGILFGLAAGITLAAVFPMASEWFTPEETAPSITVPKDTQGATAAEESGEDLSEEETEETGETEQSSAESEEDTEVASESAGMSKDEIETLIESMVKKYINEHSNDPFALESLYHGLALLGKNYNSAVVTIVMNDVDTDWFENEVETSGECSGIIWNEAEDGSLYILSGGTVHEAEAGMQVIFNDGSRRDAVLCQVDGQTGLMVLKVDGENVDVDLRAKISVLPLGNSYTITKGQLVLVVGSPVGSTGAVVPGVITNTEDTLGPDGIYRKFYLDCASVEGTNGFALSLEGEILGIITPDTSGNITEVIGISDLKGVLECLANGQSIPYLGIMGQTVTDELEKNYGLPAGVYVNEVIKDSPAYKAGIKAGDVIVRIGSADIISVRGMKNVVEALAPETETTIVVKRAGNGEYEQIQFKIVPGLR